MVGLGATIGTTDIATFGRAKYIPPLHHAVKLCSSFGSPGGEATEVVSHCMHVYSLIYIFCTHCMRFRDGRYNKNTYSVRYELSIE